MKKAKRVKTSTKKTVRRAIASEYSAVKKNSVVSPNVSTSPTTPFNWLVIFYIALFIVHSVIFYVANMIFPQFVVLGTHLISPLMALTSSTALFTLLTIAAMPIIEVVQKVSKLRLSNMHWMLVYFVVDFIGLWIIGRLAEELGLGMSSWMVVAALAVVFDIAQGLVITTLMKKMK